MVSTVPSTQNIHGQQSRWYPQFQASHRSQQLQPHWSNRAAQCSQSQNLNVISSDTVHVVTNGAQRMMVQEKQYTVQQAYHYQYIDHQTGASTEIQRVVQHQYRQHIVQWAQYTPTAAS